MINNVIQKQKIFIITHQAVIDVVGGAITVFVNFCNMLDNNGYEVYGICYSKKCGYPIGLNDNVNFINLDKYYTGKKNFSEAINCFLGQKKPNLIFFFFSFLYIESKLLPKYNNIPRILMFHSRPDYYILPEQDLDALKFVYINTTSQILFDSFYTLLPDFIREGNVVTIPNAVPDVTQRIDTNIEKKKIIYLSRIDTCKGLEFLIHSFKLIAREYPDWSIDIYGESQPKDYIKELVKLTKKLHIENQIHFMGITHTPIETFLNYDFCVFPSFYEGFGMGLAEAMSVGLPSIGLKGCTGVNELIINNYNGFLCDESYKDFSEKIEQLIINPNLRKTFSQNALINIKQYNNEIINQKWLEVVQKILSKELLAKEISTNNYKPKIFPINKIIKMEKNKSFYKWYQFIFSMKNNYKNGVKKKVIYLFGIKITLKI